MYIMDPLAFENIHTTWLGMRSQNTRTPQLLKIRQLLI